MPNKLHQLAELGQSMWYDNISRSMLNSGELHLLVEDGIRGMTSNPAIFEKSITGSDAYDQQLADLADSGASAFEIYEALAIGDIQRAADILRPVYEETNGLDGYISLEVSPFLAHDTKATIAEAHRLVDVVDRPNLMVKIPATPAGLPAIEECIASGLNINITLIFSLDAYAEVMEAYLRGLERRLESGSAVGGIASVASFFVSRVDTLIDDWIERQNVDASLKGQAAIANAKLAYALFKDTFTGSRWSALSSSGAMLQRPLWASTSTKNPTYPDTLYVDNLIGPHTVNTAPPTTVKAFMDHGLVAYTLEEGLDEARALMERFHHAGIDIDAATDQLLDEAVEKFAQPFQALLDSIEEKRKAFLTA